MPVFGNSRVIFVCLAYILETRDEAYCTAACTVTADVFNAFNPPAY